MKPWAKFEVNFINHPKFLALPASAICLWLEGKNYCDMHQTDGFIPKAALPTFRFHTRKMVTCLTTSIGERVNGLVWAPLWESSLEMLSYFHMHDYLDHNDCREEILARVERVEGAKDHDRRRQQLFRDKDLQQQIRARDRELCRYCGRAVNWLDRRGPDGATYDHVNPDGDNSLENVVVACRGCNNVKGARTPGQAGMALLVVASQADLALIYHGSVAAQQKRYRNTTVKNSDKTESGSILSEHNPASLESESASESEEERTKKRKTQSIERSVGPPKVPADPRVKEFLVWFQAEYTSRRHGADYLVKWERDGALVKQMLGATTLEKLKKYAQILLSDKTEDDFIVESDRGIPILSAKFSWLSDRLATWEAKRAAG